MAHRGGGIRAPTPSLARRWMALAEEIALHDQHLARLTTATSPTLCEGFGVGAHTAAELLIIFGDNPDRIRSEAAFAKLCGACPIPASSGMTTGRHRLNRGGHRHANAALYRAVIVRMQFHQRLRPAVPAAGHRIHDMVRGGASESRQPRLRQRIGGHTRAPDSPCHGARDSTAVVVAARVDPGLAAVDRILVPEDRGPAVARRVLPSSSVGEESLSPNHPDTSSRF